MTYFSNFGTLLISLKRLKVQNSNLARRLIVKDTKPKNKKMGQKGAWLRSGDLHFKFWDALNISGMAEDRNLKLCMLIDGKGY